MKLAELKKLKVAELRFRLKQLGLDNKGLKAELLGRLWSAMETQQLGGGDEEEKVQAGLPAPFLPPETKDVPPPSSSPPGGAVATEPCPPDINNTREFRDSSTQTETSRQPSLLQASEWRSLPQIDSECVSEGDPGCQVEVTEFEMQQGAEDKRAVSPEDRRAVTSEDRRAVTLEDRRAVTLEDRRAVTSEDRRAVSPEDRRAVTSEDRRAVTSEDRRAVSPEDRRAVSPEDRRAVTSEDRRAVTSEDRRAVTPEDRRAVTSVDRTAVSSEDRSRGRAFYEFKEEIRYKRAKSPQPPADREEMEGGNSDDKVTLDPYNGHLHFQLDPDGSGGRPRFWARFPSLWSGCRLTHGVLQGRVGFEVRLERKLLTKQLEEKDDTGSYGLRVGWSLSGASVLLGEDDCSFAYDGRGKKVCGGKEEAFGEPFSEGDIIGCYASFSTDGAVELSFHKNGRFMGGAFSLDASVLLGPLFPHVLCQSCSVTFLLDPSSPPWYPGPPGFTPLAALSAGQRVRAMLPPTRRAQCEVLLMVGLPGSGKSHWARTHMKQQPEKQYRLLGTEALLACLISDDQKDSRLLQASQCLTDLIKVAAQTPGNYILDQCNILFSARRHKLQLFTGFRRRVVVVFPSADEWKRRLSLHQKANGEQIPETALLKLQVGCSLPEQQSILQEELQYVELPQQQAQTLLQEYRDEARRLLPPIPKQEKKPRLHKKRPHPHSPPPSHRIQWSGRQGWKNTRHNMQPWRQQRDWSMPHQDQGVYYRDVGYSGYEVYW